MIPEHLLPEYWWIASTIFLWFFLTWIFRHAGFAAIVAALTMGFFI